VKVTLTQQQSIVITHVTYWRVESLGISSSLCALGDLWLDNDEVGLKPASRGLGLCASRPVHRHNYHIQANKY